VCEDNSWIHGKCRQRFYQTFFFYFSTFFAFYLFLSDYDYIYATDYSYVCVLNSVLALSLARTVGLSCSGFLREDFNSLTFYRLTYGNVVSC